MNWRVLGSQYTNACRSGKVGAGGSSGGLPSGAERSRYCMSIMPMDLPVRVRPWESTFYRSGSYSTLAHGVTAKGLRGVGYGKPNKPVFVFLQTAARPPLSRCAASESLRGMGITGPPTCRGRAE